MPESRTKPTPIGSRFPIRHLLVLILLSIVVFSSIFGGEFVWDDEIQILRNPRIRSISNIPDFFSSAFWDFAVTGETRTNYYRPVQAVTYAVAFSLTGTDTGAYHFLSLFFHVIAVLALWAFVLELGYSRKAAFAAAALFSTHPVHTEAIAWIASIPDLSAGAFYFLAIWLYLRFDRTRRQWYLWASALTFLGALFSKEMAATLPIVLLILPSVRQGKLTFPNWQQIRHLAPYGVMAAVYGGLRIVSLSGFAVSHNMEASLIDWISLGFQVVGQYIRYALVPFPLTAYHLIPISFGERWLAATLGTLVIAVAIWAAWRYRHRIPELPVLLAIFVITLTPVLYFKGIGGAFFSERYLYIPTLVIAIFAAALLDRLKWRNRYAVAWTLVAVFSLTSFIRNPVWHDSETLYGETLKINDQNAHFQSSLGEIELRRGQDANARARFETALDVVRTGVYYASPYEEYRAAIGLGALAARRKDYEESRRYLSRALEVFPDGDWAYLYLGGVLMEADGDYPAAMDHFSKAIELSPINEVALDYMGIALLNQGQHQEAIRYFRQALEINPLYADGQQHLDIAMQALSADQD